MKQPEHVESDFCKSLTGITRILETPLYRVWGCAPIYGEDGRVHVFYSRWVHKYAKPVGWVVSCEIAHAVSDSPESPCEFVDIVLEGRGGNHWDSWSIHNPSVYKVGGQYVLVYLGTDGSDLGISRDEFLDQPQEVQDAFFKKLIRSKRVGMAISKSVNGPWTRVSDEHPLIEAGAPAEDAIIIAGALANEEYSGFYQVTATTTTMPRVTLSTLPEWIDIRLSRNNTEDDWEVATHNTIDGVMVTFNRIDFCDIYRSDQPRANYIKIATR
ncbi:glycoside hydrolase family protein [Candidatus Epulonipiscium viviparus]|uniref:glycoside hydrolase family protein n=1 Tax=Candidatus Epulonipiscium viviparus TaxID=420336 RepID=UPI00016C088D|nr:glycoside hydrolase family protein [Candidatus Epulopiscium viviparus]